MDCSDIVVEGNSSGYQFAFVMAGGMPAISGAQFGISYEGTVGVSDWTLCTGGMSIPEDGWPDSGKAIAVTWPETVFPTGDDSLVVIGYFTIEPSSSGTIEVTADDRIDSATYADDLTEQHPFAALGMADVDGDEEGVSPCGQEEGQGDGQGGSYSESDPVGGPSWEANVLLVRLATDQPMPPRGAVDSLDIEAFDELCETRGVTSIERILPFPDDVCEKYPVGSRIVRLEFGENIDEKAEAEEFMGLPQVAFAEPSYAYNSTQGFSFPPNDSSFVAQWPLQPDSLGLENCVDQDALPCCEGCDLGVELAWQYSQGDSSVIVAFLDAGADMQHPDLFAAYWVNAGEDLDDDGPELCSVANGGDLDGIDTDGNGITDDIMGWNIHVAGSSSVAWKHTAGDHGTPAASIIGAVTNNERGVASLAGGDAGNNIPGIRLMQFSDAEWPYDVPQAIASFYYAQSRGAKIYTSSSRLSGGTVDSLIAVAVAELADSMLFLQAAGNAAQSPITSGLARTPGVMAVGAYDCSGGRWVIPAGFEGTGTPLERGSDWGHYLQLLGPASDDRPDGAAPYPHLAYASAKAVTGSNYQCTPPTLAAAVKCFGATSAATPHVASVAALVLSYAGANLSIPRLRDILRHTAEDVLCDPLSGCPCDDPSPDPECAIRLLGRDKYSGWGRVDAGRALTLPVVVVEEPAVAEEDTTFEQTGADVRGVAQDDTVTVRWRAFDINSENGVLAPGGYFRLEYILPESLSEGWHTIADSIPALANEENYEYFWYVDPDSLPIGPARLRVTVTDAGDNTNVDYSARLQVVHPDSSVIIGVDGQEIGFQVLAIGPNPTDRETAIRFALAHQSEIEVDVYDVAGRRVRQLLSGRLDAGLHTVGWDGRNETGQALGSGVYFWRFRDGRHTSTFKTVRMATR